MIRRHILLSKKYHQYSSHPFYSKKVMNNYYSVQKSVKAFFH